MGIFSRPKTVQGKIWCMQDKIRWHGRETFQRQNSNGCTPVVLAWDKKVLQEAIASVFACLCESTIKILFLCKVISGSYGKATMVLVHCSLSWVFQLESWIVHEQVLNWTLWQLLEKCFNCKTLFAFIIQIRLEAWENVTWIAFWKPNCSSPVGKITFP